jgi:hypothetical protein
MAIYQELLRELESLPLEAQKKIYNLIHLMKDDLFPAAEEKQLSEHVSLSRLDDIAVETGISDLAVQHDHYLYGTKKK